MIHPKVKLTFIGLAFTVALPVTLLLFGIPAHEGVAQTGRTDALEPDLVRLPQEQPPLDQIGPQGWGRNIVQIAHNDLGRRGMGAGLGVTRSGCAYVGSRDGRQGVVVLDISDPRHPTILRELAHPPGSTSREVRTVEELNLLIVENFEDQAGGVNNLQFWDIRNCRDPILRTTLDFAGFELHEFFAWRDPNNPNRLLLYVSQAPYLNVIDATNILALGGTHPYTVREVATFNLNDLPGAPQASLHSMSVSDNGRRVYMSDSIVGFYLVDSTPLGTGAPCDKSHLGANPCLRKLNPDPRATLDPSPPDPGGHHSMVRVPGTRPGGKVFAITSDEVGGPTACPWSWSRVLDITTETKPVQLASLIYPENLVENCPRSNQKVNLGTPLQGGRFRGHNPTVLKNLVVQANYASGLRIWDISNPYIPIEVGVFFPEPVTNTTFVSAADQNQVSLWSYPIIKDGLIYVAGINDGFLVLRYHGPGHEEIDGIRGPCEGNSSPVESIGILTGRCFE
jgi:hypothetical protein